MATASVPDFDNTEIAFRSRTTGELRKAQLLFRSFNYKWLIQGGERLLHVAFALHLPVRAAVRYAFFDHFCGGITSDDSLRTVNALGRFNVRSVLDYSVEGLRNEADFEHTTQETLHLIAKAKASKWMPFVVFKMTAIGRFDLYAKASAKEVLNHGETAELNRVRTRLQRLAGAAAAAGIRLLVDAEETWIQAVIDDMVLDLMRSFNRERPVIYNTLQMYRTDRLAVLRDLAKVGLAEGFKPGIKLVRGAYMEKERARAQQRHEPSPIHVSKEATDRDFDAALTFCLQHLDQLGVFVGTHNESSVRYMALAMVKAGIDPADPRIECSQLLGMGDNLTYNLAHHGFNVSKYVPYGPVQAVLPYLARRAEENTSVAGQASRELQLIERELKRRG